MKTEKLAYLHIKIKHLASEAKIIRKDENKYKRLHKRLDKESVASRRARATWLGLKQHRREDVRSEARSAQLASAFLRNVPYRVLEAKVWGNNLPNATRVAELAYRYGLAGEGNYSSVKDVTAAVKDWMAV